MTTLECTDSGTRHRARHSDPYEGRQMIQVITDQLLIDHLQCSSKSYLGLRGRSGHATDYSALCSRLDARYRASASQWLAAQSATGGVSWFGGSRLQDKATADATILQAVGVADGVKYRSVRLQIQELGSKMVEHLPRLPFLASE